MSKDNGKVSTSAFPAGATVKLHDRYGDFYNPGGLGKPVATKKADKNGDVEFDGLKPGAPFWAVSDDQPAVSVTAKEPRPEKERVERPAAAVASQTVAGPSHPESHEVVTGARSTKTAKADDPEAARKRSEASKKAA